MCKYYCKDAPRRSQPNVRRKGWWKLHKNAMNYFWQTLAAIPDKTAAVRTITFQLTNHLCKMNKTCRKLLELWRGTHKRYFLMEPYTETCQWEIISINLPTMQTMVAVWRTCRERCRIGTDGAWKREWKRERKREREREREKKIFPVNMTLLW